MDTDDLRLLLRDYVLTALIKDSGFVLADDEALISTGYIDSFSLAELGVFIQKSLGIYIPDRELTVGNMDTINLMIMTIKRHLP